MKAEIKSLWSPQFDGPLDKYYPEEHDNFSVLLYAELGPVGEVSSEMFYFTVCTPRWLDAACTDGSVIIGMHLLIVNSFNFAMIYSTISRVCSQHDGRDWEEVAKKLSRYGRWEFEDYRE